MSIAEIENNLEKVFSNIDKENFIYDFILSFGVPQATVKKLRLGKMNLADNAGELAWKKKVFFKETSEEGALYEQIDSLKKEERIGKGEYRFVILTNYVQWVAVDMKTADTLDCSFEELDKNFAFFLPLAGIEKAQYLAENPADVKAAERMAKLYDQINTDNHFETEEEIHSLNVFLSRLLFCFFAEDTGIFTDQQFTHGVESSTNIDASDIREYLSDLFIILSLPEENRPTNRVYLHQFPYVNGGLFNTPVPVPNISIKARKLILECGRLDWKAINPDIFGSMIQAVVTTDKRGGLGMHYTSVPNIMKVINPLFLDELRESFIRGRESKKELNALLERIQHIKIFDPACGSGNFLIIAYRELRLLEIEILKELAKLSGKVGTGTFDLGNEYTSVVSLNNFYGIEIDDFAHEIARLSLWLAEHQMNQYFHVEFGYSKPSLPLKDAGHIVHANACRIDWEEVCPKKEGDEIYILGNPPYLGARMQNEEQKKDMDNVFRAYSKYKDLDYISIWFYKGAKYIVNSKAHFAFVSTNSICQGQQVALLWDKILKDSLEISFAHTSFKWVNNAKSNAGVTVVIIGIRNIQDLKKFLYNNSLKREVKNINSYLLDASNVLVSERTKSLSLFQKMNFGNMPNDGGGLIFTKEERNEFIKEDSSYSHFIRPLIGSSEFIKGESRFCLWLENEDLEEVRNNPIILERINRTEIHRLSSKDKGTQLLALRSHQFRDRTIANVSSIVVPRVSSERREYIPMGILDAHSIILDSAMAVYDAKPYLLSVLHSKIHMIWVDTIGGKLKTDYRYSAKLCYNTFPFPKITKARERELEECAYNILEVRERYPEKTLAQLYDPEKMPADLKEAHRLNDLAVESCYREKPFTSDEERLEYLFKLYEKMIKDEKKKK
ncbi:class I SAM-dependent DNA methyltransferase [Myroides marinus]|nr:class I SAM-dependent DNA methyltransferase [Myroides marinus]MDM1385924.1 class I SAM-dependent DNA methyltransferase [Myroides marinus]MDM1393137.1 class I SAM-dependent DNA methyltransferase [Myroides marinus]